MTHGADIIWFSHQSISDAISPRVYPQLVVQAFDGVVANSTVADSTVVLARFIEYIDGNAGDQELGLLHIDTEPFTFHALSIEIKSFRLPAMSTRSSA